MNWSKKPVHWQDDRAHYYSIVFTWQLHEWALNAQPDLDGKEIIVGGPAVKLMPGLVPEWVTIGKEYPDVLSRHNPLATRTSWGCPRRCAFCAVPRTEGDIREIPDFEPNAVLIDNNLLGCSRRHFDRVIDSLKGFPGCDFNQGLDCRLLTRYHAGRLAELHNPVIRLAFDDVRLEPYVQRAWTYLREAGIHKRNIRCYVLIGFNDTPDDALYRLRTVHSWRIRPNPMRYNPLDTLERSSHVGPGWTNHELIRFMSYWSNLRYTDRVPFGEYEPHKPYETPEQLCLEDVQNVERRRACGETRLGRD